MERAPRTLPFSDWAFILDALEDAIVELEDNELVSQRVVDKLVSARQILDE